MGGIGVVSYKDVSNCNKALRNFAVGRKQIEIWFITYGKRKRVFIYIELYANGNVHPQIIDQLVVTEIQGQSFEYVNCTGAVTIGFSIKKTRVKSTSKKDSVPFVGKGIPMVGEQTSEYQTFVF